MRITAMGVLALCLTISAGSAEDLVLPFEIHRSAILVHGVVNGKPVLLILDTGASQTVLEQDLVRVGQPLPVSRFSDDGPGIVTRGRYTEATLQLAGRVWKDRAVGAARLIEVSKALGRRIDGLLGQICLREFDRVTIDFCAGQLVLGNR